jgi:diaminopimelate epimerase
MIVPFTKAHGAKNDFLLTWMNEAPRTTLPDVAIAICDRHTGIGADGWMLVEAAAGSDHASIRLFNSDGSEAEISGNGTRCAAAFLIQAGHRGNDIPIKTGAGLKWLKLISREDNRFLFEMNMGTPVVESTGPFRIDGQSFEATILNVGNPQCALFVDDLPEDWQRVGAAVGRDIRFPNGTNVSFVKRAGPASIDVRFFERGAGETMSSGTGSTGAAVAAIVRGWVSTPVTVMTPAGDLRVEWDAGEASLTGPAEIVARGEFYL